jgi:hypothetical protein
VVDPPGVHGAMLTVAGQSSAAVPVA